MENSNSGAPVAPVTTTETVETPETKDTTVAQGTQAVEQKKEEKRQRKLKLKVDSKEIEEELPFDLPTDPKALEYLTRQLQMAKMGNNRANYAKSLEKEIGEFFGALKADPFAVLSDPSVGVDVKDAVKKYIEREIANAQKSPEQLRMEELEAELKKTKSEREKEKEELKKKDIERLQDKAYETYEQNIIEAIESSTDLPKSRYVVKKFADYMLAGLEMGVKLDPKDVLPLVKDEIHNDVKEMFAASKEDMVENFLGKERLSNLRKRNLDKAREIVNPLKDLKDPARSTEDKSKPKLTYRQFFKT